MIEVVIATKNDKKLRELKRYLKSVKARIVSLEDMPHAPGTREDKSTFKGNAIKKAVTISKFTKGVVLADDSGLCVDALDGQPGVKSARFAGRDKKDHDNNAKLLDMMKRVPSGKRTARFVCAVAVADKGSIVKVIEEYCDGRISDAARGRHGFGYDPLFLIPKYKKTFGQLGLKVKDKMSHRSKALKKARAFLKTYLYRVHNV
ncbi:MAG: RdgB/HAM1 family non-canonical purine NTP pyrophosphatase [Candidatus Omnitrophota bacterium]|jgi:XTP/dITP diphosphohydrolase